MNRLSPATFDTSAAPSLAEGLTRARRLISDRVGVIADVLFMETTAEEPAVYWAQTRPAALGPLAGQPALNDGNGTSADPNRAAMKAIGESIERYCSAFYDERALEHGTYDECPGPALQPEAFSLFSAEQYADPDFPFTPFTRQTSIGWTRGHSLLRDRETWVPASFVYIPYDRQDREPPLDDLISTGLACGPTLASALLKGLTEALERDAYTIVWQNRLQRPHIDLAAIQDPFIQPLVRAMGRLAVRVQAVWLTLDIPVPVVLILMSRAEGPPWTIVASGADLSPRRALGLALEEACLAFIGMNRSVAVASDFHPDPDYGNLTTLMRHGLAHALDERLRPAVEFLTEPTSMMRLEDFDDVSTGNAAEDLRRIVRDIEPFVSDVVGVDVTTPDVDDVGFKVARVVVPELQRMDMDHRYRHLGGRRLYEVGQRLGLARTAPRATDFNPYPHPFP